MGREGRCRPREEAGSHDGIHAQPRLPAAGGRDVLELLSRDESALRRLICGARNIPLPADFNGRRCPKSTEVLGWRLGRNDEAGGPMNKKHEFRSQEAVKRPESDLSGRIIGAAIRVHQELGPGFLESLYEEALSIELASIGIRTQRQLLVPVYYRGQAIGEHRLDLLIEGEIVVELKTV